MKLTPSLFSSETSTYTDLQEHSRELDKKFGFNVEKIESELVSKAKEIQPDGDKSSWGKAMHDGNQTWVGLNPNQLQTTYGEFHEICELLDFSETKKIIDLGAGYGRLGLVCSAFSNDIDFIGYEFVNERVIEGNRILKKLDLTNCTLEQQDLSLSEFSLPVADVYFIYDFGRIEQIDSILHKIKELSYGRKVSVVARGRGTQSIIWNNHPWLSQVFDSTMISNSRIFRNFPI